MDVGGVAMIVGRVVGELDDVAGVGIDERPVPHRLTVIPEPHAVQEGNRAILLRDIFDLGQAPIVCSPELAFSLGDRIGGGDGGRGRRDIGCSKKKLAKF